MVNVASVLQGSCLSARLRCQHHTGSSNTICLETNRNCSNQAFRLITKTWFADACPHVAQAVTTHITTFCSTSARPCCKSHSRSYHGMNSTHWICSRKPLHWQLQSLRELFGQNTNSLFPTIMPSPPPTVSRQDSEPKFNGSKQHRAPVGSMPCSSAMTSQNLAPIWFPHCPDHS